MLIIDLFTYTIYKFSRFKLGRPKDDAMLSSLVMMTVYIAFFMLMLSCMIGLIYDNKISQLILDMDVSFVFLVGFISLIIFGIRYYRCYKIEQVKNKIEQLSEFKYKVYRYIIYFLYIAIPVLGFIFFRLYAFGQV